MKRKTLIWLVSILLVVVLASGIAYYALAAQAGEDGWAASGSGTYIQTAVAREGDLVIFASGTGELVALDETTLKFDENGTLLELLVGVGDPVSEGEVLARLQVNSSETQLAADLAKAELAVVEAQQVLDALYEEAQVTAAQALYDLETAQAELADLLNNDLELAQGMQAVADAEAAIEDAEMALYIHNAAPSEDEIYTAYASLLFKEKNYNELVAQVEQLEYEYKKAKGRDARDRIADQLDRAMAQMYHAQIAYEEALYHYETIDAPADPLDLNLSQAQFDTAQAQLDQATQTLAALEHGAPTGDIALAEAKISEAQDEWARWMDGPDPDEINLAEARLETAQLDLLLVQQENLVVDLVAPMDGTVMEINVAVNKVVEGDHILTLADTRQPLVEVYLDEADYQNAQVGNRVQVIFDALPDRTFSGSLLEISPSLESASNSQVIQGLALLEDIELALPVGLNAAVDVIAGEATDTILVPIEALQETSPGNYTVYVQTTGDAFEPREVTIGLMDFTSAEILSGLDAGEVVALGGW